MAISIDSPRGKRFYRRLPLGTYLLVAPALVILFLLFLGPAVYNFFLSFQEISFFEIDEGTWNGIENYERIFRDPTTRVALFNTVFWLTGVTVVIRLVLGLGLALLVNNPVLDKYKLSALARSMLLLPWVTPPVVAVAAWQWILHPRYGVVNQSLLELGWLGQGIPIFAQTSTVWWGIAAIIVWRELPFVAISFLAGLQAIPQELYEAARIDGAAERSMFWHITLPLLSPIIALVAMLSVIWTFNNFVYVWLTTRGGPGTFTQVLSTQLYTEAFFNYRLGVGAALGVLMSLIMTIFAVVYYLLFLRRQLL